MSDEWPTIERSNRTIARYDHRPIKDRHTQQIGMEIDPKLRELWDDHKEAAAERMGYDDLTNELFLSLVLDVYAHHLDAHDS